MGIFDLFQNKPAKTIPMDEIHYSKLNKERFISEYFIPRKPVLIKEGAKNWPLSKLWTKQYIIDSYGEYQCNVIHDSRPASSKHKTNLKDYFLNHKGKSTLTLDFEPTKSTFFLNGLKFPNRLFSKKDINRFFFYHSVKNAGTLPHFHKDAFNILRKGEKRWVMFDSDENVAHAGYNLLGHIYKKYPQGTHAKDWFSSDLKKTSKKVRVSECFQKDTDVVYVPVNYAHSVINISDEVLGIVVETNRI
jgi:ribosomal protein L16 Arg81 hydroxylase